MGKGREQALPFPGKGKQRERERGGGGEREKRRGMTSQHNFYYLESGELKEGFHSCNELIGSLNL